MNPSGGGFTGFSFGGSPSFGAAPPSAGRFLFISKAFTLSY